ncbi:winged helix-turn-helix transcriptional regulator [Nocardioides agariphilus]|jgi:DNA-binding transcriptional ArsR family regulator|uniref:Winged helix-turn-helix transcriptional regulator n=1 Tax=Nocardioides agariphilus TaxID=433664 RepID=A0A930YIX0_9ACTN|nr:metalloregulator ArsR/SmtB family transcription factor [Nocardioides agariphilus]MBF4768642.1 winged helix-turn-helix transcriptional regulator [Nocardioides agariphilus]
MTSAAQGIADEPDDGLDDVFNVLAQPVRRRILRAVSTTERSVTDLHELVGLPQPVVSRHLAQMRAAGLVDVRPVGTRRLYSVRTEGLQPVEDFLRVLWPTRLEALRDLVIADLDQQGSADAD